MNIEYTISKDGKCEYSQIIRKRIKELKSNEGATEKRIYELAKKHAKKHECIDFVLKAVHCELMFWYEGRAPLPETTVHLIAYCSLNNVSSAEALGFCEMYFNYDNYYEDGAIVKVYKLNYCSLD